MGIGLALDDFGTGYSSLSMLQQFPIQRIKIDRSFLSGSEGAGRSATLLHGVARLCGDLGMSVVVEGIETEDQSTAIRNFNCPLAQGWFYAPAVPADELGERVRQALAT